MDFISKNLPEKSGRLPIQSFETEKNKSNEVTKKLSDVMLAEIEKIKDIAGEEGTPVCWFLKNPEEYDDAIVGIPWEKVDNELLLKEKQKGKKPYVGHVGDEHVHCPKEFEEKVKRFGIKYRTAKGDVIHLKPGEFTVVPWTAEQLNRINQVVERVFERLQKAHEDHEETVDSETKSLREREVTCLMGKKSLVLKEKFPDLKKLKAEAAKKKRLLAEFREEEFAKEIRIVKEIKRKRRETEKDFRERRNLKSEERKWDIKQEVLKFEISKEKQ